MLSQPDWPPAIQSGSWIFRPGRGDSQVVPGSVGTQGGNLPRESPSEFPVSSKYLQNNTSQGEDREGESCLGNRSKTLLVGDLRRPALN